MTVRCRPAPGRRTS